MIRGIPQRFPGGGQTLKEQGKNAVGFGVQQKREWFIHSRLSTGSQKNGGGNEPKAT